MMITEKMVEDELYYNLCVHAEVRPTDSAAHAMICALIRRGWAEPTRDGGWRITPDGERKCDDMADASVAEMLAS